MAAGIQTLFSVVMTNGRWRDRGDNILRKQIANAVFSTSERLRALPMTKQGFSFA
ncbi:MAG: hypothetical protein AB1757_01025 [Acidobacteriota bacterium]